MSAEAFTVFGWTVAAVGLFIWSMTIHELGRCHGIIEEKERKEKS